MNPLRFLLATAFLAGASLLQAEPPSKALSFLRATDLPDGTRALQTASTEYRPSSGNGPVIWLVGVTHLGSADYFKSIQQRLDRQSVVLYEGIGIKDVKKGPGAVKDAGGIQSTLARALGLEFQLDAIDYRRPSFINSDLHVPELAREVRKRGADSGAASDETFDQLVGALEGTGPIGGELTEIAGFLGASPQIREVAKGLLVEVLGQAGDLMDVAKNLSPEVRDLFDVILTQRNAVVIQDLRTQLGKLGPGQTVAIFYGAAHMDEIAQRLRDELHYVPANTEWDTAFAATSAESGINPAQVRMMLEMLRTQLRPGGR